MRTKSLLVITMVFMGLALSAQTNRLSLRGGSSSTAGGAVLDMSEYTGGDRGFLVPRMTESQRNALSDVEGLVVFQTDGATGHYYNDGTRWVPWKRNVSGDVTMSGGTSTIDRGHGFSVVNNGTGRDEITFDAPYSDIPFIALSAKAIAGVPPVIPSGICDLKKSDCTNANIRYLYIDFPVGGAWEFETGLTNCNIAEGNLQTYKLSAPEWNVTPPVFNVGSTFDVGFQTFVSGTDNRIGIWVDWDQSGSFEPGEDEYLQSGSNTLAQVESITVPAGACNGLTTLRVSVVRNPEPLIACEAPGFPEGETEQVEIQVTGGVNCTYPMQQTLCNVSGLTNTGFRVECTDVFGNAVDAPYSFTILEDL